MTTEPAPARLVPVQRLRRRSSLAGHIAGWILLVMAGVALLCTMVDIGAEGEAAGALAGSAALFVLPGILLVRFTNPPEQNPTGVLFGGVVLAGLVLMGSASVPYILEGTFGRIDSAMVEAISGITTTGATLVVDAEALPRGIALWRAATQWIGAAAIIGMVVAVFPHLGIGGYDPDGGVATRAARRVAPRLATTLRRLGGLYAAVTLVAAFAYLIAGMRPFDALAHALTTASTGGFSTRTNSIGAFDSAVIEWVAITFMFVAGLSLPLVWRALRGRDPLALIRSFELRVYVGVVVVAAVWMYAWNDAANGADLEALRRAIFASVSAMTTTGYRVQELAELTAGTQALLWLMMGAGAMAASVAGGLKVVRLLGVLGFVRRELTRHLHPSVRQPVRIGPSTLSEQVSDRMVGSVTVSLILLLTGTLLIASTDESIVVSVSAAVGAISNSGLALVGGAEQAHLVHLDPLARWVSAALMALGRIEILPVLVVVADLGSRASRVVPRRVLHRSGRLER